jgi:hypothetical protein
MRKTKRVKNRNNRSIKRRRRKIRGGGPHDTYIFVSTGHTPTHGEIIYFSGTHSNYIYSDEEGTRKIGEIEYQDVEANKKGLSVNLVDWDSNGMPNKHCNSKKFQIANVKFKSHIDNEWRYTCNLTCMK